MKVGLLGLFRDIKHLVDAPVERDVKAPTEHRFEDILASVSPNAKTKSNHIKDISQQDSIQVVTKAEHEELMARANFATPELKSPDPVPIETPLHQKPDSESSVKTPSLIEINRLKRNVEYTKLSKAERVEAVKNIVDAVVPEHGMDPALSMSIIANESSFNPNAVSNDGHASKGLMQLLDSTGVDYHGRLGLKQTYDPFNPNQNVKLGVTYLKYLHDVFGQPTSLPNNLTTFAAANSSSLEKLAVAAFNAGEGRVASAQERARRAGRDPSQYDQISNYLPESTQVYVNRVMSSKADFLNDFDSEKED